jgi:hypothetical protein
MKILNKIKYKKILELKNNYNNKNYKSKIININKLNMKKRNFYNNKIIN